MRYFILFLNLLIIPTFIFSQSKKDAFLNEKKQLELDVKKLEESLKVKLDRLNQVEKELGILELEELKNGELKVSIGDREPYLLEGETTMIAKLQRNEIVTIIAYATDINRIKVYSSSLDKIGYLVPLVFEENQVVQAFIQKPENKIRYKDSPSKSGDSKTPIYSSSTSSSSSASNTSSSYKSKNTETRRYIRGSKGGCYYINSKGNKVYVDRSYCN